MLSIPAGSSGGTGRCGTGTIGWLPGLAASRVIFHFTPTGASWMNQVEIWNGIITRQLIRRGTFSSARVLNHAIRRFAADWNADPKPFHWTATADEILEKVRAVTSRMAQLLGATEIGHVVEQTA
jgi:hypothetical protein